VGLGFERGWGKGEGDRREEEEGKRGGMVDIGGLYYVHDGLSLPIFVEDEQGRSEMAALSSRESLYHGGIGEPAVRSLGKRAFCFPPREQLCVCVCF
jgi:hypothetical protein